MKESNIEMMEMDADREKLKSILNIEATQDNYVRAISCQIEQIMSAKVDPSSRRVHQVHSNVQETTDIHDNDVEIIEEFDVQPDVAIICEISYKTKTYEEILIE